MSFLGLKTHRKARSTKAAEISSSSTLSARAGQIIRNRGALLRIGLCLCALAALLLAVESWKAPFPYRLGDRPTHGILARVDFEMVNDFETKRSRLQAQEQVPLIFQHDPQAIHALPQLLRRDLDDIARADSTADLAPRTRDAFGLVSGIPAENAEPKPKDLNDRFQALKLAIKDDPDIARRGIDEILKQFETLTRSLREFGILSPADMAQYEITSSDEIGVTVPSDETTDARPRQAIVPVSEVLLSEQLSDQGVLSRTWPTTPDLIAIREPIEIWLGHNLTGSLRYDDDATTSAREAAGQAVDEVTDRFRRSTQLVAPGQVVEEDQLSILHAEFAEIERQIPLSSRILRVVTVFVLFLVLTVMNGYYLIHNEPKLFRSAGRLSIYLLAIVAAVGLGRLMSNDPWRAEVIPLVVTAMVFAVAYNQVLATLTAFTLTVVLTLSTTLDLGGFVLLISVSSVAVVPLSQIASRTTLVKAGFVTAVAYLLVSLGVAIIEAQALDVLWTDHHLLLGAFRGAGWCLVAGYLVAGSLPFVESTFGMVTDISLLEMSDVSHTLLQELVRRAPGTYNHSMAVASIGEAAADSIGANGLLVRVGAYFHDIGKMLKPEYFIENMTEGAESRHDHLAPAMSTLIIIGHVKDGVDLAQQHNLPQPLIDFIEQHHGTTLVQYFYHEASKQADQEFQIEESAFRYPGPKPQTKETGVMMLADAVESASRTLSEPTPKRIETLVRKIAMQKLLDGQFDESPLTLSEIRVIEDSLIKSLTAIYHGRIQYPEQRSA